MFSELLTSLRIAAASIVLCVVGYGLLVLGSAVLIVPESRQGQLITINDTVVGSRQIAQAFARPEYIWPRPSAVNYAADAAGGSNLSPTNPLIRERAESLLEQLGATADNPAPAELVLASGSGLDPHITAAAALYQADRVAAARNAAPEDIRRVITKMIESAGPGDPEQLVNVLLLNLEMDRRFPIPPRANNHSTGTACR